MMTPAEYIRNFDGRIVVHDELKFIWVKSLKCAGTSIYNVFNTYHRDALIRKFNGDDRWETRIPGITDQDVEDYLVFTVVRNPYERFRSMCAYFEVDIGYVISMYPWTLPEGPWYDLVRHAKPLVEHVQTDEGVWFVDRILRVENLDADFASLCDKLGIPRYRLPHLRVSSKKQELKPEWKDFIRQHYARDLQTFGYEV